MNVSHRTRRIIRALVVAPLGLVAQTALRMVLAGGLFLVCALVAGHLLGVHVPGLSELEGYFESLTHLSKILS